MKILDIGCGNRKYLEPYAITTGLDKVQTPSVDVVFDLDSGKRLPFPDGYFDLIYSHHTFEHLGDINRIMRELVRVLSPKGTIRIIVPHFSSVEAHTDLTHKHFYSSMSFNHFDRSTVYGKDYGFYATTNLKIIKKHIIFRWLPYQLLIEPLANSRLRGFYESKLVWIFPAASVEFELKKMPKIYAKIY